MRISHLLCVGILLCSTSVLAQTAPSAQGTAYQDGVSFGTNSVGTSAGAVTQSNIDNTGQTFGNVLSNPTITSLMTIWTLSNKGNAGMASNGTQQLTTCQNYQPVKNNPTQQQQAMAQYCDAVNNLAKAPNYQQVSGVNQNDPAFTNQNNAYNQGVNSAGNVNPTIGTGLSGATDCLKTTATTAATYNNYTCTRTEAQVNQNCQIYDTPTITQKAWCTIGGGSVANRPWPNFPWGPYASSSPAPGGTDVWSSDLIDKGYMGWQGGPHGTIVYGCRQPSDPYFALGGIADFVPQPNWETSGGGINFGRPVLQVLFQFGVTSAVTTGAVINYDGSYLGAYSMYYDGPTDQFYVSWSPTSFNLFPPLVSCAPTYTYQYGSTIRSCIGSGKTYHCTTTVTGAGYSWCTNPQDQSSVAYTDSPVVVQTLSYGQYASPTYYGCTGGIKPVCGWISPYYAYSGYFYKSGCRSTTCQVAYYPACKSGFQFVSGVCYPAQYNVGLGTINKDRALRLYASPAGHYSGSAGINNVVTDNVTNSCSQYQQQTSAPTATPAIAVNGNWQCPNGMTLKGNLCY